MTQIKSASDQQVATLKVLHQTQKFQEEAKLNAREAQRKSNELNQQKSRSRSLLVFISVLGLLVMGVAYLLYRERQLKKEFKRINEELNLANDKYHMLLVESNHRIKNNLQMMISMLQYANREMEDKHERAFSWMSGKIQIISILHKRLSLDIHNEKVELNSYFQEIVHLYQEMAPNQLIVDIEADPIEIKSERIVYFGLILNEMLSNTIEHNPAQFPRVELLLKHQQDGYLFSYRDFSKIDSNTPGTGTKLIRQLIKRVNGSDFEFHAIDGQYKFKFHA